MAEAHPDESTALNLIDRELNEFFKSLSTPDEEEVKWKRYTESLSSKLDLVSSYCQKVLSIPVAIKVYGSSVEGLKCYLPNDIGDVDMMVYPVNDEVLITPSDMIEYIESNPGFVRLRGRNHHAFKNCLQDNSPYIATAAVKAFHPDIFGDASPYLTMAPDIVMKAGEILEPRKLVTDVQPPNTDGPAVQVDFAQSFPTLTQQVEDMRNYSSFQMSDDSRSCFEALAVYFSHNAGNQYTTEHAKLFESFMRNVEDKCQALSVDPSLEGYYQTLNDIAAGERAQEIGADIRRLNDRLRSSEEETNSMEKSQQSRKAEQEIESEEKSAKENDKETTPGKQESRAQPQDDGLNVERKIEPATTLTDMLRGTDEVSTETKIQQFRNFVSTVFGSQVAGPQAREPTQYEDKAAQFMRRGGVDLVPALRACEWPQTASAWITRDRKWPKPEVIRSILDQGFHIVVKSPGSGEIESNICFRLSFSHAEYIVSQELTPLLQDCYRCVKLLHKRVISHREPKILTTYHLKTLLFWAVEDSGVEAWSERDRGACVMMLLDKLQSALDKQIIPHYFIPDCNLLHDASQQFPEELAVLASEVKRIKESPFDFPTKSSNISAPQTPGISNALRQTECPLNSNVDVSPDETSSPQVQQEQGPGPQFLRYHDIKALYHNICLEMVTKATSCDDTTTSDDAVTRSIVSGLRDAAQTRDLSPEHLMTILESGFENIYWVSMIQGSPDPRRRLMMSLQWTVNAISLACQQPDLEAGNEDAIAARMSQEFPLPVIEGGGGGAFITSIMNSCEPPITPSSAVAPDDDIPLD